MAPLDEEIAAILQVRLSLMAAFVLVHHIWNICILVSDRFLSVCLSVRPSVRPSACPFDSVCLSDCLYCLSVCLQNELVRKGVNVILNDGISAFEEPTDGAHGSDVILKSGARLPAGKFCGHGHGLQ